MNTSKTPPRPEGRRIVSTSDKAGQGRDARLKAALKANLARRKAQVRARRQDAEPDTTEGTPGHD